MKYTRSGGLLRVKTYTQDQVDQAAARAAAVQLAAEEARRCSCGAPAGIMMHKQQAWMDCPECSTTMWWNIEHTLAACGSCGRIISTDGANVDWRTLPACGPCATALETLGWSPEREDT